MGAHQGNIEALVKNDIIKKVSDQITRFLHMRQRLQKNVSSPFQHKHGWGFQNKKYFSSELL